MGEQLSFLTAGYAGPEVADLAGVLAGGGRLVARADTLRLSVLTAQTWRAAALLEAFAERGLGGERSPGGHSCGVGPRADERLADGAGRSVRTDFHPSLAELGREWLVGASQRPPAGLRLTGAALRMWSIAAGSAGPNGALLRIADLDGAGTARLQAALAAMGLPSASVGPRADGPGLRITSSRALRHLQEYVGPAPTGAAGWPGTITAGR